MIVREKPVKPGRKKKWQTRMVWMDRETQPKPQRRRIKKGKKKQGRNKGEQKTAEDSTAHRKKASLWKFLKRGLMFLKKAFVGIGEVAVSGYYDMVQHRKFKELSGFLAFVGNQVVV